METIFKTNKKATYFEGTFKLRDATKNYASPIQFPTVFIAFGKAIKSGNWQSCTATNTHRYVIDHYFDGKRNIFGLSSLWDYCFELEKITWEDVKNDKENILMLINLANNELLKLKQL